MKRLTEKYHSSERRKSDTKDNGNFRGLGICLNEKGTNLRELFFQRLAVLMR